MAPPDDEMHTRLPQARKVEFAKMLDDAFMIKGSFSIAFSFDDLLSL